MCSAFRVVCSTGTLPKTVVTPSRSSSGEARANSRAKEQPVPSHMSARKLDRLIEEAVVDAYNESEQRTCFYTVLEERLEVPFETEVLGVKVTVERVELTDAEEIVAICRRGRGQQAIPILELPLPAPRPEGSEWIEAYRRWAGRR